jgi:hypothetical protein
VPQRQYWNILGVMSVAPLCYAWLAVLTRSLPIPKVSAGWFFGVFFVAFILSVLAGWRASKYWYFVSAGFLITMALLWVGEFLWESR